MKTIYMHIGLHKTGTTSIQHFLQANREEILAHGYDFYQGIDLPENHVELHLAAMRVDRESGYKNRTGFIASPEYYKMTQERVCEFVHKSSASRLIFSSEGISLLRHSDEMDALKRLFPTAHIEIIVFLRDPSEYLRSFAKQIRKDPNTLPKVITSDSFAYTEPDSWLIDYEERLKWFYLAFGRDNVHVVDYDASVRTQGNVIPSFLAAIGIEPMCFAEKWGQYFFNKT